MELQVIVEEIQGAESVSGAFHVFTRCLPEFGFNHANYALVTDHPSIDLNTRFGLATNYPTDWVSFYREKSYQNFDPVWRMLQKQSGLFSWKAATSEMNANQSIAPELSRGGEILMREASDAGLVDGFAISFINQHGEVAGVGVSGEHPSTTTDLDRVAQIYLIATALHERIQGSFKPKSPIKLTPREVDVLSWAAEGKSDSDIASILGISRHAVRFHWNNIFGKLNVNSRLLATVTALRKRLITPSTIQVAY